MTTPAWLNIAGKYLGQSEVPGKESNPWIANLWRNLGGGWVWNQLGADDSSAPWCGTFAAHVCRESNLPLPKAWYRARAWLSWGIPIDFPAPGCVVVFSREGGGHVGFVVGRDTRGYLLVLGGNQGDRVSIAAFDPSRVLGYRWPPDKPLPTWRDARLAGTAPVSHNEA